MSFFLPQEIFDLIVEQLCEEQETLKICCLVSKSWVTRAQRHLFARVKFAVEPPVESWMKAFPDPSNSPAHYTRDLLIRGTPAVSAATTVAQTWIRTFCNIERLTVETTGLDDGRISLVPLHALSSTLKTLCLGYCNISSSEVFNLIYSFPSLEDLTLMALGDEGTDILALPSTPPKFTGTLYLATGRGLQFYARQLLALPGGLHFSEILMACLTEDMESAAGLVLACRNTLEILTIWRYLPTTSSIPEAPLDLSEATNLKRVMFQVGRPSVRWILVALQTVKSKNLQHISIHQEVTHHGRYHVEDFLSEWQDLDRLLVQFWTSHSIRPKLLDGMKDLKDLAPTLLPELTRRGLLDIV